MSFKLPLDLNDFVESSFAVVFKIDLFLNKEQSKSVNNIC